MAIQTGNDNPAHNAAQGPGARVDNRAQVSGMNGRGKVHLAGAVGMLGTPRRAVVVDPAGDEDSLDMTLQGKRGGPPARHPRAGQ